jgi:hypothetical protein
MIDLMNLPLSVSFLPLLASGLSSPGSFQPDGNNRDFTKYYSISKLYWEAYCIIGIYLNANLERIGN